MTLFSWQGRGGRGGTGFSNFRIKAKDHFSPPNPIVPEILLNRINLYVLYTYSRQYKSAENWILFLTYLLGT